MEVYIIVSICYTCFTFSDQVFFENNRPDLIFDNAYFPEMDENTLKGYNPKHVACEIIKSMVLEDEEVFIAR